MAIAFTLAKDFSEPKSFNNILNSSVDRIKAKTAIVANLASNWLTKIGVTLHHFSQQSNDHSHFLALANVLPVAGVFNLPSEKRYINSLSLQKLLAISSGTLSFKRSHFLSIFTNRGIIIFIGKGASEEEARFMVDFWYKQWRKDQKDKNIAVKIIDKSYFSKSSDCEFNCELKVKYAYKIIDSVQN